MRKEASLEQWKITLQQSMNLTPEYAMFHQRNLTCYWGNRDELTEKQRKVIKELGYTYRGKNQWLHRFNL